VTSHGKTIDWLAEGPVPPSSWLRAPYTLFVKSSTSRPLVLAGTILASAGCDTGSAARPSLLLQGAGTHVSTGVDAGPDASVGGGPDASASDAGNDAGDASDATFYDLCPDGMTADFPSIYTQLLSTQSCGIGTSFECHSSTGALPAAEGGTGSLLDFTLDAPGVYAELLGADGGGYPAVNVQGDAGGVVLRVAPGDAGASMLYIKLSLAVLYDPRYGEAMPPVQTLCPPAIDAVKAWIDDGAAPE
jgi:hypothetical protein